eukprot:646784-Prorocentrum_minimum.AAC.1
MHRPHGVECTLAVIGTGGPCLCQTVPGSGPRGGAGPPLHASRSCPTDHLCRGRRGSDAATPAWMGVRRASGG